MSDLRIDPDEVERFWAKVDSSAGESACWPWITTAGFFTRRRARSERESDAQFAAMRERKAVG